MINTGNPAVDRSINRASKSINWFSNIPAVAHFLRAIDRFNDRLGSQFGAAITYFSFLSLIPILMVSFAAVGFVLASNQNLLTSLIDKIVGSISDPGLAGTLKTRYKLPFSNVLRSGSPDYCWHFIRVSVG